MYVVRTQAAVNLKIMCTIMSVTSMNELQFVHVRLLARNVMRVYFKS